MLDDLLLPMSLGQLGSSVAMLPRFGSYSAHMQLGVIDGEQCIVSRINGELSGSDGGGRKHTDRQIGKIKSALPDIFYKKIDA
jgi:hypothetical protein